MQSEFTSMFVCYSNGILNTGGGRNNKHSPLSFSSSPAVDDVRAESAKQPQGAGTAAGHGQAGAAHEPDGSAERHDGTGQPQPDGADGPLPAPAADAAGHGRQPRALQGSVGALSPWRPPPPPLPIRGTMPPGVVDRCGVVNPQLHPLTVVCF